ncbi:hypothetical protein ACVBEH_18690 [Roseateles sp. GG27B]
MKMLTAADVEAAGPRLLLGKGDRLTPLARDRRIDGSSEHTCHEGIANSGRNSDCHTQLETSTAACRPPIANRSHCAVSRVGDR